MKRWKVARNNIGGQIFYQVYRARYPQRPDDAANRIYIGCLYRSREKAQEFAEKMNANKESERHV